MSELLQPAIDLDFLAERASIPLIGKHLSPGWRAHLSTGGGLSTGGAPAGSGWTFPGPPYRTPAPPTDRPGEDALDRARRALDAAGTEYAVLDAGVAPAISGLANVVMTGELARSTNEWLAGDWLEADERFLGSILVGPRDPAEGAKEIRRAAAHPRMAQVVLAFPPCLLGDRFLDPLYEACEELGLPLELQIGGGFIGSNNGPTASGHPRTHAEYEIDSAYGGVAHLASALLDGLFERFPGLRLIMSGFGIAWLPSLLWRLERVQPDAAETVHRQVRFTTRGLDLPAGATEREKFADLVDLAALLVYSSGYPWADESRPVVDALPEETRRPILFGNAASLLRIGAPETAHR